MLSGAGLKVDGAVSSQLANVVGAASTLQRRGYDGCWTAEVAYDPFLPLTLAAEHTDTLELGTSIAVAFEHHPPALSTVCNRMAISPSFNVLTQRSAAVPLPPLPHARPPRLGRVDRGVYASVGV